jgi:outer membrane protein TolC
VPHPFNFQLAVGLVGIMVALISETASNYVQLRTVQATLDDTREILGLTRRSLELTERRRDAG